MIVDKEHLLEQMYETISSYNFKEQNEHGISIYGEAERLINSALAKIRTGYNVSEEDMRKIDEICLDAIIAASKNGFFAGYKACEELKR